MRAVPTQRVARPQHRTPRGRSRAAPADALKRARGARLTLGHEPDSMEFSSLGGWIATRASGMKKNTYGPRLPRCPRRARPARAPACFFGCVCVRACMRAPPGA